MPGQAVRFETALLCGPQWLTTIRPPHETVRLKRSRAHRRRGPAAGRHDAATYSGAVVEIVTERLILRGWQDSDLAPWVAMNADPQVRSSSSITHAADVHPETRVAEH